MVKELQLSHKLLELNQEAALRFEKSREEEVTYDFYRDIKPVFEQGSALAHEWKERLTEMFKEGRPKYIHASQLESAVDNLEQQLLQSFDAKAKALRFRNTKESVDYTVQSVIEWLEEKS
nr:DUF1798 family protein [Metabacillus mangrovi]